MTTKADDPRMGEFDRLLTRHESATRGELQDRLDRLVARETPIRDPQTPLPLAGDPQNDGHGHSHEHT